MCRRCVVYKGRAVGKSTELGASFDLEVQGRIIAKVNSFKACEPVKGSVHELEQNPLFMRPGEVRSLLRDDMQVHLDKEFSKDTQELWDQVAAGMKVPKEYVYPVVMDYNENTCITAGELRAAGIAVPEYIPDCGWVPRYCVKFGEPHCKEGEPGQILIDTSVNFTAPFRWVSVDLAIGDVPKDCRP